MNESENATLEYLNALTVEFNLPVVIFITLFMLLGIVGNSLVLYVYKFRMKTSTLKVFIIYLGFVDMLGCCIAMPLEMVDLTLPLKYPWNFLCKSQHLAIHYSCISSVLSLMVISVERFNRVCRPLSPQMSPLCAKRIVFGGSLISLLLAVPACLSYGRQDQSLEKFDFVASVCWSDFSSYWRIYFLVLFTLFFILLFVIFVLYFFIWKTAKQHFRQLEARRHEAENLTHSNHETNHKSSQVNMTIFSITALFVVSFVPGFMLNLVQPTQTDQNFAFLKILHRLWVLNCSLNPIVYGICNGEFRQEFKSLFVTENSQTSVQNTKKTNEIEL